MLIGILYEGDYDEKPLIAIIVKIIQTDTQFSNVKINFALFPADGSIDGAIKQAVFLFHRIKKCDLCIFASDTDNNIRRARVKASAIKRLVKKFGDKINPNAKNVFAFPKPELEQWFISEENSIKHVLNLPFEKPLPFNELKPKERLKKIIDIYNKDITITPKELYEKIALDLDLSKLTNDKSFKSFFEDLLRKI